jgi:hypothetical protein
VSSAQGFEPYTRCPACRIIAPSSSMEYAIGPDGGRDWDYPVRAAVSERCRWFRPEVLMSRRAAAALARTRRP